MRIKSVRLKCFKRFTDTTVHVFEPTVKLIMMAGPNGSGKSSFLEGMRHGIRVSTGFGVNWDEDYFVKIIPDAPRPGYIETASVETFDDLPDDKRKAVYVRSAYRNDPDFTLQSLQKAASPLAEQRFDFLIQNDATVSRNFQLLASGAFARMFETAEEETTVGQFREETIGELRAATSRLFPDLLLSGLGDPLRDGTFRFTKGVSKRVHYKNMSGGEKSAFDLLLDMQVKSQDFDETVFCIDEPEAHVNPRLHGPLLQELYNLVNDKSQLWVATHSPGMMRQAAQIEKVNPGTVAFIDFGGRDFDSQVTLAPEPPTRAFWRRTFEVAFDDAASLMLPRQIIICEGPPAKDIGGRGGLDEIILEKIFEDEFPDARFVSGGAVSEVERDRFVLVATLTELAKGVSIWRVVDRDDKTDDEMDNSRSSGIKVLNRRHLESYLLDDEVLTAVCKKNGQADKVGEILDFKKEKVAGLSARGKPADDIKAISGELMQKLKIELRLTQAGSTFKEFALKTLVPCLGRETGAYQELKRSIFE